MAQQINQRTVPVGGDEPKRAWFDEYARSDRGILEFATLAAANTWANDPVNAGHAIDGRHAWITAEDAVYVRIAGAWEWILSAPSVATAGPLTLYRDAAGTVSVRYSGQVGSQSSGTVVGTVPAGYRPSAETAVVLTPNTVAQTTALCLVSTSGTATLYMYGATLASSVILRGSGAWRAN